MLSLLRRLCPQCFFFFVKMVLLPSFAVKEKNGSADDQYEDDHQRDKHCGLHIFYFGELGSRGMVRRDICLLKSLLFKILDWYHIKSL